MDRPKLYLAGPISKGPWARNCARFHSAHDALMEAGFAVLNPGLTMHLECADDFDHETWLECCFPWVKQADVLVRLPGHSEGSDAEVAIAKACGVQVFGEYWLPEWDELLEGNRTPVVTEAIECLKAGLLWCQGQWSCPPEFRSRYPAFAQDTKDIKAQPCAQPCQGCGGGEVPAGSPAADALPPPSFTVPLSRLVEEVPPLPPAGELLDQAALLDLHQALSHMAAKIMAAKNSDYANPEAGNSPFANFQAAEVLGVHPVLGLLLRTQDKLHRLKSYCERGDLKVVGEGWQDACLDVINYMVLCYGMLLEKAND